MAALAVLLGTACATPQPGLSPPGYGGTAETFFFPLSLALDTTGENLYVANSNFDQNFTSATLVQIPTSVFNQGSNGAVLPLTSADVASHALFDNFIGQMVADCPPLSTNTACANADHRLYAASRGNALVSTVLLDSATGHILCPSGNCALDAVHLGIAPYYMTDPFALTIGTFFLGGSNTATENLAVTHMSQGETSTNGVGRDAMVAVIPEAPPATAAPTSKSPPPFADVSFAVDIGQPSADAIAISPSGTIYVGGCYVLITGESVVPCDDDENVTEYTQNPLRFFFADANGNAEVQTANLGNSFSGGQIVAMAMASSGQQLYLVTSTPNALVTVDLPQPGITQVPVTRSVVPLANGPNQMLVLPRTGQGDLVAVTASDSNVVLSNSGAFLLVDPVAGTVVAQLQNAADIHLGRQPYGMAAMPTVTGSGATAVISSYRVYVALFFDCGVAAIDIPTDAPQAASIVSTLGTCPLGI